MGPIRRGLVEEREVIDEDVGPIWTDGVELNQVREWNQVRKR